MSLIAEELETFYGPVQVLHGASIEVPARKVVALLGRNGMGKTTLLHSIAGVNPPRAGRIALDGKPIQGLAPELIYQDGITLMPQGHRVFPSLTVAENLEIGYRNSHGNGAWTLDEVLTYLPLLKYRMKQVARTLSGGEQQMLTLGRTLLMNGSYAMLDEPVEGLAPAITEVVAEVIKELRRRGTGVLLVEQRFEFAMALADEVYVMSRGVEVFVGTPQGLRANEAVQRDYLGV